MQWSAKANEVELLEEVEEDEEEEAEEEEEEEVVVVEAGKKKKREDVKLTLERINRFRIYSFSIFYPAEFEQSLARFFDKHALLCAQSVKQIHNVCLKCTAWNAMSNNLMKRNRNERAIKRRHTVSHV